MVLVAVIVFMCVGSQRIVVCLQVPKRCALSCLIHLIYTLFKGISLVGSILPMDMELRGEVWVWFWEEVT